VLIAEGQQNRRSTRIAIPERVAHNLNACHVLGAAFLEGSGGVKSRIETIGRLKCRTVDDLAGDMKPGLVVILCHGYGASGSDLVPIGEELFGQFPQLQRRVQFVFPEAPLSLDHVGMPGGRAWWQIDLEKLQLAAATGRFREMQQRRPDGLEESRERLVETLHLIGERTGIEVSRIVVGGFSQGAMLSTDVTLHLDVNPAALIAMSGSLLNESEWQQRAPRHSGLRVLQSHGTADPLLPFASAESLRDLLTGAGAKVEFIPFQGGHQIPLEVFERIGVLLESLAGEGIDP
jgi:phospholipase/carboxylesterase